MSHALFRSPSRRRSRGAATVALVMVAATVPAVSRPTVAAAAPPAAPAAPAPAALDCTAPAPDETNAMAAARACGRPVENLSARSETQDVFANADGTWTAKIYAGPVRMRDAAGAWTPIDLTMRAEANGQVAPVAHPGGLRLSGKAGDGEHELLSVEAGGKRVSIAWNGALAEPVLSGNRATYPEVRPGVDLVVEASTTGVEQFFVVKNAAAAANVATLRLPVLAPGLTSKSDGSGGLVFTDGKGKTVGTSPTPEMWDATIDPATGGPKRVTKVPVKQKARQAGGTDLTLSPAKDFFTDPATVYPVVVDPQINPLGVTFDTYVKEGDTVDRSGSNDLQLGLTSGNVARSFIGWNTGVLLGRQVTAATFNFYNWYSQSCTAAQWEVWTTDAATSATRWGSQPAWRTKEVTSTATKGFNSSCKDGWVSVNGLSFLQRAVTANKSTAFMGLKATDETSVNSIGFKQIRSSQPAATDQQGQQPYAVVTYNSYPNALDATKLQPGDATETGTRTPEMKGVFSDPDGGTGRVDFEVYDRTGATLKTSGSGTTVSNGSESVWTVPSGKLDANTTYKWRARGHDGSLAGPWSEWRFMTTSDGSPAGEQRRFSFQDQDLTDRLQLKVNVANGNLLLQNTDLQIHGTGLDLTLDRYYNSRSTATSTLGKGWTLGTAQDVKLAFSKTDHATADITYHAPTGFTAKFINSASNTWNTPSSLDAKLTRNTTDGEFRLKFDKSEASFYFADSTGRLLRSVDKNKNKITFGYDGSGNVTTITDSQDRVTTLAYASGRLTSVTDPANRRIGYGYDGSQNLQTVTDSAGGTTRFDYTGDRLTKITTPEGRVTNLGYEPDTSRMIDYFEQVSPGGDPDSARYTFTYSAGKTEVTSPSGNATGSTTDGITTHTYETRDRVTEVKDPLGHKQGKKYNADDNVETNTDALTNTTSFGYDPNTNNLTSIGIATGAKGNLSYNNTSHPNAPSGSSDPQGNSMSYSYDAAGNKTATESAQYPGKKIDESEYNDNGTVKWREDGKDVKTNYSYDAKGNLTKVDNPAPLGDIAIVPDPLSRMSEQTDGKGQKTKYTYDQLDRPDRVTYQDGTVVDYDYDRDGNLIRLTDPTGITSFSYDGFGRQTTKQAPGAAPLTYQYDRNGNLTRFIDAGGAVTYAYNEANLLTSMQEPGASGQVTFTYDDNNRRRFMYLPTSPRITVEMKYDKSGRQTSIVATNDSSGAKLSSFSYDYTKNGVDTALRQSVTDLSGTTTYSYDKLNRLTKATAPNWSRSYDYDENFNRTSKTEDGTTTSYDYNDAHQLTKGGSTTYSYDADGNLTNSSSGWRLGYNAVNSQTTTITAPGKPEHQPLQYGGADQTERRRAGSVTYGTSSLGVSSATSLQSYNVTTGAGQDDMEPSPGTSSFYTRDSGGNLISLVANGARYYYLVDGLGSVVGLVNGSAQKVNSYSYDPYGNQLSVSQQVANPWRYASGFYDGPTGLTKFGARYYDPGLGRFSQRDPSGRDLPYAYAGANPANNTDPTGLDNDSMANDAFGLLAGGLIGLGVSAFASMFVGPLIGGAIGGCIGGMVGTAISQHGDVNAGGLGLNCFAGAVVGLAGGIFVKGGYRGGPLK